MKLTEIIATTYSEDLLQISLNGKIQSIYNKTLNVVNTDQQIYSICQNEIFNGPRQIKVNQKEFKQLHKRIGKSVEYLNGKIKVGNETIVIKEVPIHCLHQLKFPKRLPSQTIALIDEIEIDLIERLDTVGFFMKSHKDDLTFITNKLLKKKAKMLTNAIMTDSKKQIEESIRHLIGLGFGLTPSGDDFLTGMTLITNSHDYPFNKTRMRINDGIKKAIENTNIISKNELELAMEGKSLEPIVRFIDALYNGGNRPDLTFLVNQILEIGSSSGSDILFGIIATLKVTNEKMNQKNEC